MRMTTTELEKCICQATDIPMPDKSTGKIANILRLAEAGFSLTEISRKTFNGTIPDELIDEAITPASRQDNLERVTGANIPADIRGPSLRDRYGRAFGNWVGFVKQTLTDNGYEV